MIKLSFLRALAVYCALSQTLNADALKKDTFLPWSWFNLMPLDKDSAYLVDESSSIISSLNGSCTTENLDTAFSSSLCDALFSLASTDVQFRGLLKEASLEDKKGVYFNKVQEAIWATQPHAPASEWARQQQLRNYFKQTGFTLQEPIAYPHFNLATIRNALSKQRPVLLQLEAYNKDTTTGKWQSLGLHQTACILGYTYNHSWQEECLSIQGNLGTILDKDEAYKFSNLFLIKCPEDLAKLQPELPKYRLAGTALDATAYTYFVKTAYVIDPIKNAETNCSNSNGNCVDLSRSAPIQAEGQASLYDESCLFCPPFALNQSDPGLSDLFEKGSSQLCVSTCLAQACIWLSTYADPMRPRLLLNNYNAKQHTVDGNALIRKIVSGRWDPAKDRGTVLFNSDILEVIESLCSEAYYTLRKTEWLLPQADFVPNTIQKAGRVTVSALREALKKRKPVMLCLHPYSRNDSNQWEDSNWHMVTAYGYEYNTEWGEERLILKVFDPAGTASEGQIFANEFWISKINRKEGRDYPKDVDYFVSSRGYSPLVTPNFLRSFIVFDPDEPASFLEDALDIEQG